MMLVYAMALAAVLLMPVQAGAEESRVLEIPVSVLAEGSEPDWDAVYTLELVAQAENCPMPEGSREGTYRMAVQGGSTGTLRFPAGEPGEYDYILRQIPGKVVDCTYDDRQFRLHLAYSGDAVSAMTYDPEGEAVTDILFCNRWAEPAWVTLSAWNTLDSGTPEDGRFTFRLYSEDGQPVAEVKNQGRKVVFPPLRFSREGVYRYIMKEQAEPGSGIVHDRAVYTLTVTVYREGDYRAEVSCQRNERSWDGIPSFANYSEGTAPQTGDPIFLWTGLMILSGMALTCLGKRRNRKEKDGIR